MDGNKLVFEYWVSEFNFLRDSITMDLYIYKGMISILFGKLDISVFHQEDNNNYKRKNPVFHFQTFKSPHQHIRSCFLHLHLHRSIFALHGSLDQADEYRMWIFDCRFQFRVELYTDEPWMIRYLDDLDEAILRVDA